MKINLVLILLFFLHPSVLKSSNKISPHYKIGKRYTVNNITYQPRYYEKYEQIGWASWYGPGFHGKKTANGETFNKNLLSAAHTTMPLPSIVKVINLENNKSIILKVNDRGPFIPGRIIDLSERAAIKLGFKEKGLAKVKIVFLKKHTEDFIMRNKQYLKTYAKHKKTNPI